MPTAPRRLLSLLLCALVPAACVDGEPPAQDVLKLSRLTIDRTYLKDSYDRYVMFHGINLSGSTKVPTSVDAKDVPTYIGKPFLLKNADAEFSQIRALGFNVIRLLLMWEAIEPVQRGQYDKAYLDYIRKIVLKAKEHGIYVLMDMHQDMFSRHLKVKFNPNPRYGKPGSLEYQMLALGKDNTEAVQGDGAPKWAVQACLQEKKMDSKYWGEPRLLSGMDQWNFLQKWTEIATILQKLTGAELTGNLDWMKHLQNNLPGKFEVNESTDMLPFTNWGLAHLLSLDVARSYACLLAGATAFPRQGMDADDKPCKADPLKPQDPRCQNIQYYLQGAFARAWVQAARQVKDLDNVIGYDIMNEPGGNFITLAAVGGMVKFGALDGALKVLKMMLGDKDGADLYQVLVTLRLLPPDTEAETLKKWGLEQLDMGAAIGLNNGFDDAHLRPFYARVGKAILAEDKRALIFIEGTLSINMMTGGVGGIGGFFENPMRHPATAEPSLEKKVVWAPHWYPDIYPHPAFAGEPREFTAEEVRYRDYGPKLKEGAHLASYSMGNIPVVYGEFGTYFNFNNKFVRDAKTGKMTLDNKARANKYAVSSHILNNYYEAMEKQFISRIQWCWSSENTETHGDLWNREDFSVLGPDRKPRSTLAWSRPYARALAGKPISTHFHSDFHYFDPQKGTADPRREFEVRYASKESSTPTEIFVPQAQYADGFYVWVSDGFCHYDHRTSLLYHYPARDDPGAVHWVRLRPPISGKEQGGWKYFFKGDQMVGR